MYRGKKRVTESVQTVDAPSPDPWSRSALPCGPDWAGLAALAWDHVEVDLTHLLNANSVDFSEDFRVNIQVQNSLSLTSILLIIESSAIMPQGIPESCTIFFVLFNKEKLVFVSRTLGLEELVTRMKVCLEPPPLETSDAAVQTTAHGTRDGATLPVASSCGSTSGSSSGGKRPGKEKEEPVASTSKTSRSVLTNVQLTKWARIVNGSFLFSPNRTSRKRVRYDDDYEYGQSDEDFEDEDESDIPRFVSLSSTIVVFLSFSS